MKATTRGASVWAAALFAGALLLSGVAYVYGQDSRTEFWSQGPLVDPTHLHGLMSGSGEADTADDFEMPYFSPPYNSIAYVEWWGRDHRPAVGCAYNGFWIGIYDNVPAATDTAMPYAHPGACLYSATVMPFCAEPVPDSGSNHAYGTMVHYCADLAVPFSGAPGHTYWISISSIYTPCWPCHGCWFCWVDCLPGDSWGNPPSQQQPQSGMPPWAPSPVDGVAFVLSNDFACPVEEMHWGSIKALYR